MASFRFSIVSPDDAQRDPYPYVYAEDDGGARELRFSERDYLEEAFHPGDGGRPYVKSAWEQLDGWGSPSGFVRRDLVPSEIEIRPAPPGNQP